MKSFFQIFKPKLKGLFWIAIMPFFTGCIGDDFIFDEVDPVLRIMNTIDTIALNDSYQFEYTYLNNVGREESVDVSWTSSNPQIISIDDNGLATALQTGSADIMASFTIADQTLEDRTTLIVGNNTITNASLRSGTIKTTSSYVLEGDFTMEQIDESILLKVADNYKASSSLPGLYLYLSNNPNSVADAFEVGAVAIFDGAHEYTIEDVAINTYGYLLYYCKPFNVKVGDGKIE